MVSRRVLDRQDLVELADEVFSRDRRLEPVQPSYVRCVVGPRG
jgi:hypothetical protein